MLWFTKSRRAQNDTDYETWIEGGVVPTLNAFDNGDIRATVLVVRMREGKPGGGKGPLISENRSLTLATANDQTLFVFYGNRVDDIRMQGDVINTLQARMGTGGNNMPMVAKVTPIHDKATRFNGKRKLHNGEYALDGAGNGLGIGKEGNPMNTLTQGDRHAVATSVVRRLTPTECERLQGFPDGWTEGQSDTNRYKQMGNAVAVPVVEWIIQNICDTI
jgi:hypothetical protein